MNNKNRPSFFDILWLAFHICLTIAALECAARWIA